MFHLGAALLQNLAVSPELTLRPSLSGPSVRAKERIQLVSPELTLRPSLSDDRPAKTRAADAGVAGANAPAFVERISKCTSIPAEPVCRRS